MPTETGRFSATGEITGSGASEKKTRASNTFGMTGKDGAAAVWMPMQIWCGPFITWMELRSLYTYDAQGNLVEASENVIWLQ